LLSKWVNSYRYSTANCSGHGACANGFCECGVGWKGFFCHLPDHGAEGTEGGAEGGAGAGGNGGDGGDGDGGGVDSPYGRTARGGGEDSPVPDMKFGVVDLPADIAQPYVSNVGPGGSLPDYYFMLDMFISSLIRDEEGYGIVTRSASPPVAIVPCFPMKTVDIWGNETPILRWGSTGSIQSTHSLKAPGFNP
jgi:hypothetical protein